MNALIIGMYAQSLLLQSYPPAIRCWGIQKAYVQAFGGFSTFDMAAPFEPSLEDYPDAIGFIFQRPVYILDDEWPLAVRMTVHLPGQIGFIDQQERISWIWSN